MTKSAFSTRPNIEAQSGPTPKVLVRHEQKLIFASTIASSGNRRKIVVTGNYADANGTTLTRVMFALVTLSV